MHTIEICMGSSCFARGNGDNLRAIREFLSRHQVEALVQPVGHLCRGECSEGPNLVIDGQVYHGVEPAAMPSLLARHLKAGGAA